MRKGGNIPARVKELAGVTTALKAVSYHGGYRWMTVFFPLKDSVSCYVYKHVSVNVFTMIMSAPDHGESLGRTFGQLVRDHPELYPFTRIY